jgi:hypothetical protein
MRPARGLLEPPSPQQMEPKSFRPFSIEFAVQPLSSAADDVVVLSNLADSGSRTVNLVP